MEDFEHQTKKYEEWENSIEGIFYNLTFFPDATLEEEQDKIIIAKTLKRLSKDIRDKVLEEIIFIVTGCSTVIKLHFAKSRDKFVEKNIGGRTFFELNVPIIILNLGEHESEDEKMNTVAHEIAHYILKHEIIIDRNFEREADNLAVEWGFGKSYKEDDLKGIDKLVHKNKKPASED